MDAGRPSLSRPSYGSMTGRINWMRGVSDMLARPGATPPPPVQAPVIAAPVTREPFGGLGAGDRYYTRGRNFIR